MGSLSYGAEFSWSDQDWKNEKFVTFFKRKSWKVGKLLHRKDRTAKIHLFREILAEELVNAGVPAHLTRRAYRKWIIDRDGSICGVKPGSRTSGLGGLRRGPDGHPTQGETRNAVQYQKIDGSSAISRLGTLKQKALTGSNYHLPPLAIDSQVWVRHCVE